VNYVRIDWAYGRAANCAIGEGGEIKAEGVISVDEDGLAKLVLRLGQRQRPVVEMMSGAVWVRDRLGEAGWQMKVAHARKVRDVPPLAAVGRLRSPWAALKHGPTYLRSALIEATMHALRHPAYAERYCFVCSIPLDLALSCDCAPFSQSDSLPETDLDEPKLRLRLRPTRSLSSRPD
jgi:hypothetical protein